MIPAHLNNTIVRFIQDQFFVMYGLSYLLMAVTYRIYKSYSEYHKKMLEQDCVRHFAQRLVN